MTTSRPLQRRPIFWVLLSALTLTCAGFGLVLAVERHPWWLGDEWACSQGEIPAQNPNGGSGCYDADEPLPVGVVPDPLGNRPFNCSPHREGWRQIYSLSTTDRDCLRDGLPLPPNHSFTDPLTPGPDDVP